MTKELPYELPPHLSPSSISTFQQCPLKYKYSRVNKISEPPTEATLLGNFVHDVLESFYKHVPRESRNSGSLRSSSTKVWVEGEWEERVFSTVDDLNSFRWNAWWCLENIFKIEDPSSFDPLGIEQELDGSIGGAKIKGFIDRWEMRGESTVISDYKTGKTPNPRYVDDKFVQLLIYAIVLSETNGKKVDLIELLYLKDGKKFSKQVEESKISEISSMIENVNNQIHASYDADNWEAIPTKLCYYCFYKHSICEYWNGKK